MAWCCVYVKKFLGKNFFSFCACFCLTNLSVCVMLGKQGALGPSALLRRVLVVLRGPGPLYSVSISRVLSDPQHTVSVLLRRNRGVSFGKKIFLKRQNVLRCPSLPLKPLPYRSYDPPPYYGISAKKGTLVPNFPH